ncbi:hypothetical protein QUA83_19585 [Microcoleus sp. K1-B1]|uniref:hypothetical protein n=1 Tax=Microcoleus sp. K1-B6 TaxID=2818787 RepID=UPI002FD7F28B
MAAKVSLDHACPHLTIKNSMGCGFCRVLTCNLARLSEFVRSPRRRLNSPSEVSQPRSAIAISIASFLDTEALGFVDCKAGRGQ